MVIIKWRKVKDIRAFVNDVLEKEADDISQSDIDAGIWYLDELKIAEMSLDNKIIEALYKTSADIDLTQSFIDSIKEGKEIYPLIVLWKDVMLVDGYHRLLALKSLGIKKVQVFRQWFD